MAAIQKDKVELARAELRKRMRSEIRLQYSIAADEEINNLVPEAEELFNTSVMNGVLPEPAEIVDELLGAS